MQRKKDEPMNDAVELSIVIPLFNEEECVEPLYAQLKEALELLEQSYEITIVDDGSTDRSFELLNSLHAQDKRLRVIPSPLPTRNRRKKPRWRQRRIRRKSQPR